MTDLAAVLRMSTAEIRALSEEAKATIRHGVASMPLAECNDWLDRLTMIEQDGYRVFAEARWAALLPPKETKESEERDRWRPTPPPPALVAMVPADRAAAVFEVWSKFPRFVRTRIDAKSKQNPESYVVIRGPNGAFVGIEYNSPTPAFPAGFSRVPWASDYNNVAPWYSAWWRGFWGHPLPAWADENWHKEAAAGQAAARTPAAEKYRSYVETCRAALRAAGWEDDEIP